MSKSALELASVARAGAGLSFSGRGFSALDLISIARAATEGNTTIHIRDVGHLSTLELGSIGRAGAGHVILYLD